jgi:uncharacterized protein YerC
MSHRDTLGLVAAALAVGAVLVGCNQHDAPAASAREPDAQSTAKLADLEERIKFLEDGELATVGRLESLEDRYNSQDFDPTDSTYQRVDARYGFGSFAISVHDVRAFGDGVRLTLHVGNLTTAGFYGVKLRLKYGPRSPHGSESFTAWKESIKSKDIALTEEIQAGHWTPVTVTLPGIAPDHFGYLNVSVDTDTISLLEKKPAQSAGGGR